MQNTTWDLSVFYQGYDDPAIQKDIQIITETAGNVDALLASGIDETQKLEQVLKAQEDMTNKISNLYSFIQYGLSTDASDAQGLRYLDKMGNLMVDVQMASSKCTRYIGAVEDLDAHIAKSEFLASYAFVLHDAAESAKHSLPEDLEKWVLRLQLDGADAFSKMRDKLMANHTVELDGKSLPLPAVRGMAYDADPAVRKAAYEAELASYKKVEDPMAYCLACIKGDAMTTCEAKNFPDILTQQLTETHMDKETLDAMWTAIVEALPDFRRYMKAKAKVLGHQNGLPFYDLFAPVGDANLTYTIDEAHALLVKVFTEVHPELGAFIDHAFENRWIDVYPKEGKSGGAFCGGSYELDQSRILTNFVGSFSDVSTLAHELGHAWHNRCLQRVPLLRSDAPMPLAETASIFNETLLNQTIRKTADAETKFALLESSLMESTQTVVDIYSRFLFESAVFEARKSHIPTADELNEMMLDAQDKAYGDGLDPDVRHGSMWVNKSHYYNVGLHFYNFPYAFGLLFGLGVYAKYQAEGSSFMTKYDALLASCGSDKIPEVAASVGIDVRSADYWRSALDVIRAEVDEFEKLCEKR
ncbi:MAG: M3 family oligoendopeptidase [Clostridiales bacterium]|nr:M3 family oligoendopeptidase [Clostridiales bacterium]